MIREKLALLRRFYNHPTTQLALAGIALEIGVKILVNIVTDLREEVTTMTAELAAARSLTAQDGYPAPADVDPLGRGAQAGKELGWPADDDELEPVGGAPTDVVFADRSRHDEDESPF